MNERRARSSARWISMAVVAALGFLVGLSAQTRAQEMTSAVHGERPNVLLIRNVRVVRGHGVPARGGQDVIIRDGRIERIGSAPPNLSPDATIDGRGRTLLPGFFNMHGHILEERGGLPMPLDYQMGLWLACGITTVRDLGSPTERTLELRGLSQRREIAAPRIHCYPFVSGPREPEAMRQRIRELAEQGADGIKAYSLDRDTLEALVTEARIQGLPTTIHMGIEETDVWDAAQLGMTSIEHWYGVPDAALIGVQQFPPEFDHENEVDRFRYAGRLWREADPDRLESVLATMVESGLAWDPTFAIYEAARDSVRARNQPWFRSYLHPGLERFFRPSLKSHGSFFIGWSNTDEVYWKENYRIWMAAVRRFADMGGIVTCGEDAGFIYRMFGFGYLRELELHEEAGFHPLEVIEHATWNAAQVLGVSDQLGRIREGYLADLVLVNGNPLENLRLLYPTGTDVYKDGRAVQGGKIEWTIKDGVTYHGPTLMKRVGEIVQEARAAVSREGSERR